MLQIKRSLKNDGFRVTAPGEHITAECTTVAEVQTAVAHYYGQDHNRAACPICRTVNPKYKYPEPPAVSDRSN